MLNSTFLLGTITGVVLSILLVSHSQLAEALYSIPPTPAYSNIRIDGVWNNATSYRDSLEFTTGGGGTLEQLTNVTDTGCASNQVIKASGGQWICADDDTGGGGGGLGDLTDVTLTGPAYNHILQFLSGQWINKLFAINTQSASNDVFVTGINNQTGVITTKQFSVNLKTCGGTDKISSINNATGNVICTTDATGAGGSGIPLPSSKKFGALYPSDSSPVAFGTLEGATLGGTESFADDADGVRISTATGTTSGTDAGVASSNGSNCHREWNCYLDARVQTPTISGFRLFVGFFTSSVLPNSDTTFCDSGSCFGFWTRSGSTIVQNIRNDADTTADETATALTENTSVHRYEVYAKSASSEFCYKIDSGSEVCFSTEIPAATTDLFRLVVIETSDTTSDAFEYYYVYSENDK